MLETAPSPTSADRARVLVIDDEPDLLELLDAWFTRHGYAAVTAQDGFAALSLAREARFDVVVTDLRMPGLSGLHVLGLVKELDPDVEVIILTGQGTMEDAIEALREGRAFDFLQKPLQNLTALNTAVERAMERRRGRIQAREAELPAIKPVMADLTPRESEIMAGLARGWDNRAIADRLCVSEKTIKNHLTRIYEKLNVKNRTQAVLYCQHLGWV